MRGLLALPQVVGQVLLNVPDKMVGVLGVEVQHLVQAAQVEALKVAVGQSLYVRVGLDHAVVKGHVGTDQVTFTCTRGQGERGGSEGQSPCSYC